MYYYYKLFGINERGELVSAYGGTDHTWPIKKWVRSERIFSSSETIVDALSKVKIEDFSVVARCKVRGGVIKSLYVDEIQSKSMFIVEARVWSTEIRSMIKQHLEYSSTPNTLTAQFSTDFFTYLSDEKKVWWNDFLNMEIKKMIPYHPT
jgi:hypothetical protein